MKRWWAIILVLALVACNQQSLEPLDNEVYEPDSLVAGTAGSLDTSFGSQGRKRIDFALGIDNANAVAIQGDGKILAVGDAVIGGTTRFALTRLHKSGALDTSFGGDGKVITPMGQFGLGQAVLILPGGKILVGGNSDNNFGLVRYNPNGSLDLSFGGDGKVITRIGRSSTIQALALQSDGKIVAAGETSSGRNDFALARYNPNGSLDTSFGVGGKVVTQVALRDSTIYALALQSDGKIVVGGSGRPNLDYDFILVRYNPDGSLDPGFGGDGIVITQVGQSHDHIQAVRVLSNGKILVAGSSFNPHPGVDIEDADFAVVRYRANGTLDPTFGTRGITTTHFGESNYSDDRAKAMVLQSDGKIVLGGNSYNPGRDVFALARYTPDGVLDTTFGNGGKVRTIFGSDAEIYSMALQSDGKIVGAGYVYTPTIHDFALVRYNP